MPIPKLDRYPAFSLTSEKTDPERLSDSQDF